MRRFSIHLALVAALATVGACSLINAPDPVKPGAEAGAGGAAASASSSSKAASSSTASNSSGNTCSTAADCTMLNDACGVGVCINGMCQKQADQSKEGMPCDDGLFCTDSETCQSGVCTGAPHGCPPA